MFLADLAKYLAIMCCIGASFCAGVWAFGILFERFLQQLALG